MQLGQHWPQSDPILLKWTLEKEWMLETTVTIEMCYRWLSKCFNCTIVGCWPGVDTCGQAGSRPAIPGHQSPLCSRKQSKVQLWAVQAAPAARGQMSKSQPVPGSGQESPGRPGQAVQCSVSDQRSAWTHVAHHAHRLRLSTHHNTVTLRTWRKTWTYQWTTPAPPQSSSSPTTDKTWTFCCFTKCTSRSFPVSQSSYRRGELEFSQVNRYFIGQIISCCDCVEWCARPTVVI